jgi:predicted phage-related endonuclease
MGQAHHALKYSALFIAMQRTEEWHRQRRGKLTASCMGQALGLTPWGSPKKLAEVLRGDAPPIEGNIAMQWGTDMECNGLLEYQAQTLSYSDAE